MARKPALVTLFTILALVFILALACTPAATPTPTATQSPPTPTPTPTPTARPGVTQTPTPTQPPGRTPTATPTATPTPTTAPTATPPAKKGGILRIASVGSVQSFDPLWTTASATANVSGTILEGLIAYTKDYGLGKQLLDSWETSADGLTWTFRIRSGVKFHDGRPLTTKQVVCTLDRQKDGAPLLKLIRQEFGYQNFQEFVQAKDDLTFTIRLREPTGLVLNAIGPQNFTPQIVTEEWCAVPQTQSAPGNPIGTGPYRFESWRPGDRWTAVRYEGYVPSPEPADGDAGGHVAYIDRVDYLEIPDQTTRVAALEVGDVDLVQEFPPDLIPRIERNPRIALYDTTALRLLGHFNHTKPPFDNVEARRALVMAYDNEKALLAAVGDPDFMKLCPSLLQCGTQWETSAGSQGLYNAKRVAEAKQIIERLGLKGTKVRLMDPTDRQPAHGAAQVTREVLEELGFDVDFQVMDWATMVSRRADPNLWEFFHTWSGITVRASPVGHLLFGELQYNAWFNKYQDVPGKQRQLFSQLLRAKTEDELKRLNEEFQTYFYEDAIFLQIGEFFGKWGAHVKVKGLHSGAGGQNPYDKWIE